MLVTLPGIVTLVKPVQLSNAPFPILFTLFGIVTLVKPSQLEKASSPISVTLSGIVMPVNPLHQFNAASATVLVPDFISYSPDISNAFIR